MLTTVGEIREINRYPVKSLSGESLETCFIEPYGLQGDRYCSFYDETKTEWWRYVTARMIPDMLTYQAKFVDGEIRVEGPDGRTYGWDDELLQEIQSLTRTRISMSSLKAPHPEAQHPELLSVDGASVLLITDASLRKLEAHWGKPLDQRRFRGNFVVGLKDQSMFEGDWIGKELAVGDALLKVDSFCQRCVFVTIDPDTRKKDPSLLKQVNKEFGLHFGVYASVVKTGHVRIGDKVKLN